MGLMSDSRLSWSDANMTMLASIDSQAGQSRLRNSGCRVLWGAVTPVNFSTIWSQSLVNPCTMLCSAVVDCSNLLFIPFPPDCRCCDRWRQPFNRLTPYSGRRHCVHSTATTQPTLLLLLVLLPLSKAMMWTLITMTVNESALKRKR